MDRICQQESEVGSVPVFFTRRKKSRMALEIEIAIEGSLCATTCPVPKDGGLQINNEVAAETSRNESRWIACCWGGDRDASPYNLEHRCSHRCSTGHLFQEETPILELLFIRGGVSVAVEIGDDQRVRI